jgi:hypothetical protein
MARKLNLSFSFFVISVIVSAVPAGSPRVVDVYCDMLVAWEPVLRLWLIFYLLSGKLMAADGPALRFGIMASCIIRSPDPTSP